MDHYSGSRLTYALLNSATTNAGESLESEWTVAGARLEGTLVIERMETLPKPVHCVAAKHGRKLRIECGPLPRALQPDFAAAVARARSGSSFVGRLMQLGDVPVLLRVGGQDPVRVPVALLGRWTEEFVLDPRPEFAQHEPSASEAISGIGAVVLINILVETHISGIEGR
jgi:hypothetical protein